MRRVSRLGLLLAVISLCSCASRLQGSVSYDEYELADPKQVHVVWRGWASLTWRQSMNRDVEIGKAVVFILDQYPPGASEG